MAKVFPLTILGVAVVMTHLIDWTTGRILEKTTSTCNGPCGQLALSCPVGQRIAVRDAVYSVQKRTPKCRAFKNCSNPLQDVCCEQTSQDCSFMYPWEQLKILHRNCSAKNECNIQTERWDIETVQCPASNTQFSSQTTLNYVCINDTMVAEICSAKETIIQGRTLFAMMDSRGQHKPIAGSVCTCIAETITWPTTNTITVFLVDVRLSTLASSECSNVSLSVRSGNNDKPIHCQAASDPRTNLPFVAVLNNSNVATLTMEIHHSLPEFVLLGFEANENEDIQLTCKLQGLSPVPTDGSTMRDLDAIFENNSPNTEKSHLPALIGGIVAGVLLVAALVAIVIFLIIRTKKSNTSNTNTEEPQPEYDITYYSTTDEALKNFQTTPENQGLRDGSDSFPELYVSAEEVIANKRKSNPVPPRDIHTPGYSDTTEDDYTIALEEVNLTESPVIGTNVKLIKPNRQSVKNSNYDRLNRQVRNSSDTVLDSYDQLVSGRLASATSGINSRESRKNSVDSNYWVVNDAYDDTDETELPERVRGDGQGKRQEYFELEKSQNKRPSDATYLSKDEPPHKGDQTTVRNSRQPHTESAFTDKQTDDSDDIYNDAESEVGIVNQTGSRVNAVSSIRVEKGIAVGKNGISRAEERQSPVAAPRRKSRVSVLAK